jgi:tight adherence protein B
MNTLVAALVAGIAAVAAVIGVHRAVRAGAGHSLARGRQLIGRTRWGQSLGQTLGRGGLPMGPDAFVWTCCLGAGVAACAGWLILGSVVVAVIAAGAVVGAAWVVVSSADRRYLDRFASQLPVVAQQLAGAIGAGLSLRQAIARVAADAAEPAAMELARISRDLELGARVEEALEEACERLPSPGLRTLVVAVLVQRTVGGNLSQALADLSRRLEERAVLEREARSATAQARMSAWLVAGLPLAGGVLVEVAAPGTLARTLGRGPGLGIVVVAAALQIIGIAIIRRIIDGGEIR